MRDSLRARLVLWYALVLALVVVLYGGAVVYQSWRSTTAAVDAELDVYAREITKALKPVDGSRFDLELPTTSSAAPVESSSIAQIRMSPAPTPQRRIAARSRIRRRAAPPFWWAGT
jgi:hypothetical protein